LLSLLLELEVEPVLLLMLDGPLIEPLALLSELMPTEDALR
jgi:hypothetical protein